MQSQPRLETAHIKRTPLAIEPTKMHDGKPVIRYFVSYAHDDDDLKDKLLKPLKQRLAIAKDYCFEAWDDGEILAGEHWHEQIQAAVARCQFGLLLVSPAFLGSAYIQDHELRAFVASNPAAPEPEKRAIPVALKRIPFDNSIDLKGLEQLQVFHDSAGRAFQERSTSKTRDDFASELFQQILKIVKRYGTNLPTPTPQSKPHEELKTKLRQVDSDAKEVAGRNDDQGLRETMQESKLHVFLSYSHEDIGMAKRIYNDLSSHGISVWFDQASLKPGQNWEYEIENAIEKSRFFIILLSSDSVSKKGYVQREVKKAISLIDLFPEDEVFVIPVRLEECEVRNSSLRKRQWVDLFPGEQYLNGIKKIASIIKPDICILRSVPSILGEVDVFNVLISHGFYERRRNPNALGANVQLKKAVIGDDVTWIDHAHSIMWNDNVINLIKFNSRVAPGTIHDALEEIEAINDQGYASFHDWRIPTLEEVGTLLSPSGRYWEETYVTCDRCKEYSGHIWVVDIGAQEVSSRISSYFHAESIRLVRNL